MRSPKASIVVMLSLLFGLLECGIAKTTSADQNGNDPFVYLGTAPHAPQSFASSITKASYDPSQPPKWSGLEATPFCYTNAPLFNSRYTMTCPLLNKLDKRVIYNIWQRSDSPEAFYAWLDVLINPNGAAAMPTFISTQPGNNAAVGPNKTYLPLVTN